MLKAKTTSQTTLPSLYDDSEFAAALAEFDALKDRAEEAEKRRARAVAAKQGFRPGRNLAEMAKSLVAGGRIPSGDPDFEISAADQELSILGPAIAAQTEILTEIKGRKSAEVSRQFTKLHAAELRRMLAAMAELHDAHLSLFSIVETIRAAGYEPSASILDGGGVPICVRLLGDPQSQGTQAFEFRRWLEKKGF